MITLRKLIQKVTEKNTAANYKIHWYQKVRNTKQKLRGIGTQKNDYFYKRMFVFRHYFYSSHSFSSYIIHTPYSFNSNCLKFYLSGCDCGFDLSILLFRHSKKTEFSTFFSLMSSTTFCSSSIPNSSIVLFVA